GRSRGRVPDLLWPGPLLEPSQLRLWPRRAEVLRRPPLGMASARARAELLPPRRYLPRRDRRRRLLLLVLGPRLVPLRLSARGADAHLRALLEVPDLRREVQVHLVQRLHVGLSPGHRH